MMKYFRFITLVIIISGSLFDNAQSQEINKVTTINGEISAKKIENILSFFPSDQPGGTLLITQNGQHIVSAALGKANLELDSDLKIDNVFNIASVTKPFTAVAIFTLIEQGKISLTDRIEKFIPDFPIEGKDVTIGHLLSHSSGMEYKNDEIERNNLKRAIKMKREDVTVSITNYFTKDKFDNKPGVKHDYNNAAYQLLGYIIEKITDKTYEEYLENTFFKPLHMNNTLLESSTKVIKNRATGYDSFNGNEYQIRNIESDDSYFYAAGGLMSTVKDLSIWYDALMNYKIINNSNLKKLITPIKYDDGTYGRNGYGVFTGNLNGHNFILHDGLGWGYGSIIIYFPESKLFIAHLRNCGYCKYDIGNSYNSPIRIASILLDSEYLNGYSENLDLVKYAGTYSSSLSQNDRVIIEKENKLYLESEYGLIILNPINKNTFFIERKSETLTFEEKENKEIRLIANSGVPIIFDKN